VSYGHEETRDLPLEDFLNKIRAVSTKHILYTIHALDEMNAEVELISTDEEAVMKCMFCSGEMEKRKVPYSVDRKGYHLYIREVPAYVCSQ